MRAVPCSWAAGGRRRSSRPTNASDDCASCPCFRTAGGVVGGVVGGLLMAALIFFCMRRRSSRARISGTVAPPLPDSMAGAAVQPAMVVTAPACTVGMHSVDCDRPVYSCQHCLMCTPSLKPPPQGHSVQAQAPSCPSSPVSRSAWTLLRWWRHQASRLIACKPPASAAPLLHQRNCAHAAVLSCPAGSPYSARRRATTAFNGADSPKARSRSPQKRSRAANES